MSRNVADLHPALQLKVAMLKAECEKQGLKIEISECVRTVAEQNALYAKGRTAPGKKVTNAKGTSYSSMHQWGVAVDFYRNDGKGAYTDNDGFFAKVGRIGTSIGLEWGGKWKSPVDKPHFQLPDWGSTASKLKTLYGTPDKFTRSWNKNDIAKQPDPPKENIKNPYTEPTRTIKMAAPNQKGNDVKWVQYHLVRLGFLSAVNAKRKSNIDGICGKSTEQAIRHAQGSFGITVDGKCGKNTIEKMKK